MGCGRSDSAVGGHKKLTTTLVEFQTPQRYHQNLLISHRQPVLLMHAKMQFVVPLFAAARSKNAKQIWGCSSLAMREFRMGPADPLGCLDHSAG
jgi:hypothetical protein